MYQLPGVDCDKAERLLEQIRRNPRSQSPDALRQTAEVLGYQLDRKRGKGSHVMMRGGGRPFSISTGKDPVTIGVVKSILAVLEEVFDDKCGNRKSG